MEFAITGQMQLIGSDDSWLPRGARSFLLSARLQSLPCQVEVPWRWKKTEVTR